MSAPLRSRLSNYPGESFRLGPNWDGPHFPTACDQQRALEPHLLSVPEVFDTVLMTPFLETPGSSCIGPFSPSLLSLYAHGVRLCEGILPRGLLMSRVVSFKDGMKLGLGYDRLSGDVLPSPAVQGSGISAVQGAAGQQVSIDCVTVQDVETLHRSLGISVDAGGSYMGFSGSAKVDYVNSCDFSSFSTYVMVRVSVQDAFESLDGPVFGAPDAADFNRHQQQRFATFANGYR